ncbi:imm11 family protein [Methylosinus sporium]|uniref:Immunity MXAN-0049 protein domain-containing protein n=1 Tax=Methylosinus sporium TaxID=428 RepID=A0A2U1SNE7_METSR|nr:DUF1629 domain-containing protein [Methylosinus sporium]PWB93134.1 hypothetical protein C5689_14500 [Methylosinus sporium]
MAAVRKKTEATPAVYLFQADMTTNRKPMFDFVQDEGKAEFSAVYRGKSKLAQPQKHKLYAKQQDTKKLCDILPLIGFICVSRRVKEVIEEFEKGVHVFYPVHLLAKDGAPYAEEYFLLLPGHRFNAFIAAAYPKWDETVSGEPYLPSPPLGGSMSLREIAGRHLWRQLFAQPERIFVSGELHDRLEREKIRYATYSRYDAFDTPWSAEKQMAPYLRWAEEDPKRIAEIIEKYPEWARQHRPQWMN